MNIWSMGDLYVRRTVRAGLENGLDASAGETANLPKTA